MTTPTNTLPTTQSIAQAPSYPFTKDLTIGTSDREVKLLQQYLNSKGFIVSATGSGSIGLETLYFGPATQSALSKFQQSVNIRPASGYFGSITRHYITLVN